MGCLNCRTIASSFSDHNSSIIPFLVTRVQQTAGRAKPPPGGLGCELFPWVRHLSFACWTTMTGRGRKKKLFLKLQRQLLETLFSPYSKMSKIRLHHLPR